MVDIVDRQNIHKLVQEQYEKFPYPAAEDNLDNFIERKSFQGGCPSQYFHLYWPYREKTDDLDILVAGCGTMQAAKFAVNLPNARFTAIDISRWSLEHTGKLLKLHGINNVATHLLPIEEIGTLGQEFDLIISTGVLHHLPDPLEGLKALQSVLRKDGAMYLMLYGKYGRDGIYYMQELFRRTGLDVSTITQKDITAIRKLVDSLPHYHPLAAKRHLFGDLHIDEELVDLFLHPQDRAYSIPDIVDYLDTCDLKLQSMLFRSYYAPRCCGLADSDLLPRIERLPEVEQLSIGELYRAAVRMHFFVACGKDRDDSTYLIDLHAPDWKSLIPVRNPALAQDTSNLPPGCSAYLFSPTHQFKDTRCPIYANEVPLISLSNNQLSIGEIQTAAKNTVPAVADDEFVRQFFKKMRDYDIVSFRGHRK